MIWGLLQTIIGIIAVLSCITSLFSWPKKTASVVEPTTTPSLFPPISYPQKGKSHFYSSFKKNYRKLIAVLASHTVKGYVLLFSVGLVAFGTGVVVLFIDMPIIQMGVLSVISVVALIFFVAVVRARFFPPSLTDGDISSILDVGTETARPHLTFHDLPAHLLAVPMSMGNRTGRGDALILSTSIVAILTGYAAIFLDLPLMLPILLGALSLVTLVFTVLVAAFGFSPAKMAAFVPAVHKSTLSRAATGMPAGDIPGPISEPVPIDLPEKPVGGIRDVYWVQSPYVYIKIVRRGNLGFVYTIVEPVITTREKIVLQETYNHLREVIIYDNPEKSSADQLKRENIYRTLREYDPTIKAERLPILYYFLRRDLSGFGLLEPLMHDPMLEDISCNGENLPVFVFHRIYGSLPTSVIFHQGELNQYGTQARPESKQTDLTLEPDGGCYPAGRFASPGHLQQRHLHQREFFYDPEVPHRSHDPD